MYRAPCAPLPTARFESTPSTPTPGQQITFDASPSNANGGTIAGYRWDFDNDGRVDATGETVTHTYSSESEYRARLTVEKRCGVTNVTVNQVSVSSDVGSEITGTNESFVVESTTRDADFNYTFRVDGRVERVGDTDFGHGGEREAEDADQISENSDGTVTVRGFTGNLYGDAYVVDGELLAFERTGGESGYRLEFNGTDVTRELTGSSAETMDQPITGDNAAVVVESTTRGADFNYTFTVAGTVERVEPNDFDLGGERAAEEDDRIIENSDGTVTVHGFTGNLYGDAFVIDGELRSFQRTGGTSGYRVEVNGADATEAVAGTGASDYQTATLAAEEPPIFEITELFEGTIGRGDVRFESTDIVTAIENTGDTTGTQNVTLTVAGSHIDTTDTIQLRREITLTPQETKYLAPLIGH